MTDIITTGSDKGFNADDAFDTISSIKGYMYQLKGVKRGESFLKPNSHALTSASKDITSDWSKQVINIIISLDDGETISNSSSTSVLTKVLRRNKTFNVYTNDYKGKIDNDSIYIMTIGEDFDEQKHQDKEQIVYYLSNITPSSETPDNIQGLLGAGKTATEIACIDFNLIDDEYVNAETIFTKDDAYNSQPTNRIVLDIPSNALINAIEVKGRNANNEEVIVKADTTEQMTPIMFNVVDDKDKLTLYTPWFDHDIALPLAYAKLYTEKEKLEAVIKTQSVRRAVLDMLIFTYAYDDEFGFAEYVTEGNDAGNIKGNQYIGWTPKQISSIAGKDPISSIDSIYSRFLIENPQLETTDEVRQLKQFVAALSRFIKSKTLTIGQGKSSFNKIYMPFVLRPFGSLNPVKHPGLKNPIPGAAAVESYVFEETSELTLESIYFGIESGKIINDKKINLSADKMVQTDTKTILPKVPDQVRARDKTPKAGDVDTSSSNDIQYLFFTHIDQSKLQQFFGTEETIDVPINKGTEVKVAESTFSTFGKKYDNPQDLFKDLGYQGSFKSGTLEPVWQPRTISGTATTAPVRGGQKPQPGSDLPAAMSNVGEGAFNPKWYVFYSEDLVKKELGYEEGTIRNFKGNRARPIGNNPETISASFEVLHYRIKDLEYIISNSSTGIKVSTLDRKTIFDKQEWKTQVDAFSVQPQNPTIKYSLEIILENQLEVVDEIIIRSLWADEITLHINGVTKTIRMFNSKDETIATERILLK